MFSTSDQVMALLKKRFTVPLPRDSANKDLQDRYHQSKVLPVRLRVFNMAKHWIDRYSHRCLDDERFMKEVDDLTHIMADSGMEKIAATLKHSIQRQREGTLHSRSDACRSIASCSHRTRTQISVRQEGTATRPRDDRPSPTTRPRTRQSAPSTCSRTNGHR
jgi:hypothetical protein